MNKEQIFTLFNEDFLRKDSTYCIACKFYNNKDYLSAINEFSNILDYKNSKELHKKCIDAYISDTVASADSAMSIKAFEKCFQNLQRIEKVANVKPAVEHVKRALSAYIDAIYIFAIKTAKALNTTEGYTDCIKQLEEIKKYKDVKKPIAQCKQRIAAIRRKHIIKRIIAIATVLAVAVLAILIPVFIDSNVYVKYSNFTLKQCDGGYAITAYKSQNPSVEIPSSYLGKPVVAVASETFQDNDFITRVTIPDSVISVGKAVFSRCTHLKTIYCEAERAPSGWRYDWLSDCNAEVVWGYKAQD